MKHILIVTSIVVTIFSQQLSINKMQKTIDVLNHNQKELIDYNIDLGAHYRKLSYNVFALMGCNNKDNSRMHKVLKILENNGIELYGVNTSEWFMFELKKEQIFDKHIEYLKNDTEGVK